MCGGVPVVLGGRWPLRRYARGVKQDLGGHADRYEATNRDEHANLRAKLAKRGTALESLRGEVGKLNELRGARCWMGSKSGRFLKRTSRRKKVGALPPRRRRTQGLALPRAPVLGRRSRARSSGGQVGPPDGRLLRFRGGQAFSGIAAG